MNHWQVNCPLGFYCHPPCEFDLSLQRSHITSLRLPYRHRHRHPTLFQLTEIYWSILTENHSITSSKSPKQDQGVGNLIQWITNCLKNKLNPLAVLMCTSVRGREQYGFTSFHLPFRDGHWTQLSNPPDISCGTWNSANSIHRISPGSTYNLVSTINEFWNPEAYSEEHQDIHRTVCPVTYLLVQQTGFCRMHQDLIETHCVEQEIIQSNFQSQVQLLLVDYVQFLKCCWIQRKEQNDLYKNRFSYAVFILLQFLTLTPSTLWCSTHTFLPYKWTHMWLTYSRKLCSPWRQWPFYGYLAIWNSV